MLNYLGWLDKITIRLLCKSVVQTASEPLLITFTLAKKSYELNNIHIKEMNIQYWSSILSFTRENHFKVVKTNKKKHLQKIIYKFL